MNKLINRKGKKKGREKERKEGLASGEEREEEGRTGLCTEEFQLINEGMKQIENHH